MLEIYVYWLEVSSREFAMSTIASRVKPALFSTSIFTEMNTLAQQYNAVNLGQGKPDADTPSDIIQRLIQVSQAGCYNQYAPAPGTPALRQAVADHAARFYNLDIDPLIGQRLEHLRRDADVRTHADADERNLADPVVADDLPCRECDALLLHHGFDPRPLLRRQVLQAFHGRRHPGVAALWRASVADLLGRPLCEQLHRLFRITGPVRRRDDGVDVG